MWLESLETKILILKIEFIISEYLLGLTDLKLNYLLTF